ncbi:MAG TPA: glycoside hydrolase family 99-like domain-containing protein [Roseiflexaceae bacterium]|nr:glycoside hydrolase family 99-like domain-containing protein [Roseiflexaceae bacterium]
MPTPQDIRDQLDLLQLSRDNVQFLLKQMTSRGGQTYASVETIRALRDNRSQISKIKQNLRVWNIPVEDLPNDNEEENIIHDSKGDTKHRAANPSKPKKTTYILLLYFIGITIISIVSVYAIKTRINSTNQYIPPANPIIAFYYPWYEYSDWSYEKMSDLPNTVYVGSDETVMLRHLQQAEAAGIHALICIWFGPDNERLDKRCRRLLQLVQEHHLNIRIAIMPDQSSGSDPSLRTLDGLEKALTILDREFMSSPAYFTFRGKPVVFWFNPSLLEVDVWKQVRMRVDPEGRQFWFGGAGSFQYLDVYDALYYFDITAADSPEASMRYYEKSLENYNSTHNVQKPFIATVMPGFDDTRYRAGHRRARENGDYYRRSWLAAIDHRAEAVIINSFNEFILGSHIEPSEQYGNTYLKLTRTLSQQYQEAIGSKEQGR